MDIAGITGGEMQQYVSNTKRQQSEMDNFQAVLDKAASGESQQTDQEIRDACESFESYFLQMMFREMRKTSFDENGFIAKSNAEKIFTDMLDEEVSHSASKSGGIGLAEMMYKQMTQHKTTNAEA